MTSPKHEDDRLILAIKCSCGATLRMAAPASDYTSNTDARVSLQAKVAEAFLSVHSCAEESAS